jgi:hypothetical protein
MEYGGGSDENEAAYTFCPKCAAQAWFFDAVCPGCVSSFGQCGLSDSFGYAHKKRITADQLAIVRSGRCPFRVNGTTMFSPTGGMEVIDISEQAPTISGNAVADAIEEYIRLYPSGLATPRPDEVKYG